MLRRLTLVASTYWASYHYAAAVHDQNMCTGKTHYAAAVCAQVILVAPHAVAMHMRKLTADPSRLTPLSVRKVATVVPGLPLALALALA